MQGNAKAAKMKKDVWFKLYHCVISAFHSEQIQAQQRLYCEIQHCMMFLAAAKNNQHICFTV